MTLSLGILIFVSTDTEINRYYIHKNFYIILKWLNYVFEYYKIKINLKFFRGKFHKHFYLDPLDTNGYGFTYIDSASKFQ